jgi:hypothetical protein
MDINMTINGTEDLMTALQNMDPELIKAAAGGLVALYIVAVAAIIYLVARYLLRSIGLCSMYHKAGVAPWKAFIPVYNTYNNYKLSWNGKLFFLAAALNIASIVLGVFTEGAMAFVSMAASIGLIYMVVKQNIKMAKLFGKGAGTGIALIFFPGITSLILGLGKAEFQGEMIENN